MSERMLQGLPASPGTAAGAAILLDARDAPAPRDVLAESERAAAAEAAEAALAGAAAELDAVAAQLRADGRDDEADIVETGALMALDPALADAARTSVLRDGLAPSDAVLAATALHADAIAAIDDPMLAARADDVRSLGRRAARLASGEAAAPAPGDGLLVARDLGPADVAELHAGVRGIALAAGGPTAHAAIVARSLGIPMVTALGDRVLSIASGTAVVVDGDEGSLEIDPSPERTAAAVRAAERRLDARRAAAETAGLPATTTDGRRVTVLANVAGAGEVALALESGAEGIGLLRTELAFLDARAWPDAAAHERALRPVLAPLAGRTATVRVLDLGGDKQAPFLAESDREARGLELLLRHPAALEAQLVAILRAGAETDLRILLPMVEDTAALDAAIELLERAREHTGVRGSRLGAMVETPGAAEIAPALAARSNFLSIGTNDLTASALEVDRFAPGRPQTHHPRVLAMIDRSVRAAHGAGIALEVCGEAASDPRLLPLLVGLGVDEVSVGSARVGTVRTWVRTLEHAECERLAARALAASGPEAVAALVEPVAAQLASVERGDAAAERLEGGRGVVAVGPQP